MKSADKIRHGVPMRLLEFGYLLHNWMVMVLKKNKTGFLRGL